MSAGAFFLAVFLFANAAAAQTVQPALSSQDLGSVQLNGGTPGTATLTFTLTNSPTAPVFRLQYQVDYTLGQASCSGGTTTTTCTVPVTFSPQYPGLRQDAVEVLRGGTLLATAFLHGLGLGPQAVLLPGVISTFAGTGTWGTGGNPGDNGVATSAILGNRKRWR
jgi:hypothetical protein